MRRFIFVLMALSLFHVLPASATSFEEVTFADFLSYQKAINTLSEVTFGEAKRDNLLDKERFATYLPTTDSDTVKGYAEDWYKGEYCRKGEYVVAFLPKICYDANDPYKKWFMENDLLKYIVVVYRKDGKITDRLTVGMGSDAYRFRCKADDDVSTLVVESGALTDGDLLLQYEPLQYAMARTLVTVTVDGKIHCKTSGESWIELAEASDAVSDDLTFEQYLALYEPWEKEMPDSTLFFTPHPKYLDFLSLGGFVPDSLDCRCMQRKLSWNPCGCKEYPAFYLCCMEIVCEYPKADPRYVARLILTYRKDGTLIACRNIGEIEYDSDERFHIRYSASPLAFTVEGRDGGSVTYTIASDGKITARTDHGNEIKEKSL